MNPQLEKQKEHALRAYIDILKDKRRLFLADKERRRAVTFSIPVNLFVRSSAVIIMVTRVEEKKCSNGNANGKFFVYLWKVLKDRIAHRLRCSTEMVKSLP